MYGLKSWLKYMRASKNIRYKKLEEKKLGNKIQFDLLDIYDNYFFFYKNNIYYI